MNNKSDKSGWDKLNNEEDTYKEDVKQLTDQDNMSPLSPNVRGGDSVSGSTADPESDDDVLQNAHEMGIAPKADLEHPTELNIEKDINDAEVYRKSH